MKNPREGRIPQEGILLSLLLGAAAVGVIGYLLFAQPAQTDSDSLSRYEYEGESVSASDPVADIPAMDAAFSRATRATFAGSITPALRMSS